jgi:hypothetical protein
VDKVEVVGAHRERATLRVGDVFLKIDADQTRTDVEVEAMAMALVPWWSLRCPSNIRWLRERGYGSPETYPEFAVLNRAGERA